MSCFYFNCTYFRYLLFNSTTKTKQKAMHSIRIHLLVFYFTFEVGNKELFLKILNWHTHIFIFLSTNEIMNFNTASFFKGTRYEN